MTMQAELQMMLQKLDSNNKIKGWRTEAAEIERMEIYHKLSLILDKKEFEKIKKDNDLELSKAIDLFIEELK